MSAGSRGTLFLVVGPSGAGKDTLLAAAGEALAQDRRYHFARRVVTRPAEAGGEPHEPASPEEFAALARAGAFALSWSAHGLDYGIRREDMAELGKGRHVVANVSRAIITDAQARFPPVVVISITASAEVLARRLAARGRESEAEIRERLARAASLPTDGEIRNIDNSGELAPALAAFRAALQPAISPRLGGRS